MTSSIKTSSGDSKKESWMNNRWRPMMGWSYMLTCIADFVVFPVLWSVLQSISKGQVNIQWQPITLQGAGLYHIAMGAVLGIAAFGRTQEKLGGANNGGLQANVGTTYTPPIAMGQQNQGSYSAPVAASTDEYSMPERGFTGRMQSSFSEPQERVNSVFKGKMGPPAAYEPEL